ncbi:MAG: helix-turn-helix domain-containing protein [Chloroflexota bacterium]
MTLLNAQVGWRNVATYGDVLRRFRERAGVSQRALAQAVGISHTLLNRSESEARIPPDAGEIRRVAAVLRLTADERDELLATAGFWPSALLELGPGDPTLRSLAVALTKSGLSNATKSGLRQAVEAMVIAILEAGGHSLAGENPERKNENGDTARPVSPRKRELAP